MIWLICVIRVEKLIELCEHHDGRCDFDFDSEFDFDVTTTRNHNNKKL